MSVGLQAAGILNMISYGPNVPNVTLGGVLLLPVLAGNYALKNLPDDHPFNKVFREGVTIPGTSRRFKNIMAFSGLMAAGVMGTAALSECLAHGVTDPNIYKLVANFGFWTIQGLAFYAHGIRKDAALPGFITEAAKKLDQMNGPYFTEACNVAGGVLLAMFGQGIQDPRTVWIGCCFAASGTIAIIQNAIAGQEDKRS